MDPQDIKFEKHETKEIKLFVTKKGFDRIVKIVSRNKECDFIGLSIKTDIQPGFKENYNKLEISW
jgi:hypothetical protein